MSARQRRPQPARPRSAASYRDHGAQQYDEYYEIPYAAAQAGHRGHPDDPYDDNEDYEVRRRGGLVTPTRLLLTLAFLGSGVVALYGLFVVRSLPITISSLAVLGISSGLLGLIAGAVAIRAGREGSGGRAVFAALLGGFLVLGASASLAAALVLGLLVAPE